MTILQPRALAVLLGAVTLAACVDEPMPDPPPGLPRLTTQAAFAAVDSQGRTGRSPEAVPTWLALAIPGFGGFAFDTANGDLIVWVKDVRRGDAAREAVQRYLRTTYHGQGGRAGSNPPVRVQAADFDFLELGSVRDRVNEVLANEPGPFSIGISAFSNRVELYVDADAVDRISATLRRARVPAAAIRINGTRGRSELAPLIMPPVP